MKIIPRKYPPLNSEPFFLKGGRVGCLLIHGFTGTPNEMRQLGDYLAARGITVSGIRLAGHGTVPDDMAKTGWSDWTASAERGLADLREKCDEVFVAGLSMGGALTLYLAARHDLPGAASLAGATVVTDWRVKYLLPVLGRLIRFYPKDEQDDFADPVARENHTTYEYIPVCCVKSLMELLGVVRDGLPKITCPLLIMHSRGDKTLTLDSAHLINEKAGSERKELVILDRSGHVITEDIEKEIVFEKVYGLIAGNSRLL